MFRDLKEYQEIQKIYEQNVYESPDDKFLKELFEDINTHEEAEYVLENIDYLFDLKESDKGVGKLITGLKNSKQINKVINYIKNIQKGFKNKPKVDGNKTKEVTDKLKDIKNKIQNNPTVTGSKTNIKPNEKVTDIVKSNKTKDVVKVDGSKVKGDSTTVKPNQSGVDKIKDAIKNNPGKTAAVAGGATVTGALLTPGGEPKKEEPKKEEPKKEEPKKEEPKVDTPKVETKKEKPKRLSSREKMRKRNEILHGKERIDYLRKQNTAFQKARNKKDPYTMDQFVNDFPKSQTAKRKKLEKLGGPGFYSGESYNPIKDYHTANDLAEVYRNMYNTSSEQETIMELSPARPKRFSPGKEPSKPSKPAKPSRPGKPNMGSDPVPDDKGNDPVPPTPRDTAPEPKRPAPKRPGGSNKNPRVEPAKMRREDFGYDAYDLILEYLLGTEQVDTIEEANYVMTEMDQQTIHDIVLEMEEALNQLDENMVSNAMTGATRAVTSGMANTAKSVGGMVGTGVGQASSMLLKGARKAAELLKKAPKSNPIPTGPRMNPSTGFPSKRMSGGGSY